MTGAGSCAGVKTTTSISGKHSNPADAVRGNRRKPLIRIEKSELPHSCFHKYSHNFAKLAIFRGRLIFYAFRVATPNANPVNYETQLKITGRAAVWLDSPSRAPVLPILNCFVAKNAPEYPVFNQMLRKECSQKPFSAAC
jgi:hypothetical protein